MINLQRQSYHFMMKKLHGLLLLLLVNYSFGQFAVIKDKDGYCNVRDIKGKKKNILDKLYNGHLIYCFGNQGNWTSIDYPKHKMNLSGKIYLNRYTYINEYKRITKLKSTHPFKISFKRDSIKVTITQQKFDRSKHSYTFYKAFKKQIEFIDNNRFWGTTGAYPRTQYKSIEVTICNRVISLPPSALENVYQIYFRYTQVYYDSKNDILYITASNGDGPAAYDIIWKIEKGIYKERFIEYGV